MPEPTLCCPTDDASCVRGDLLAGSYGLHMVAVKRDEGSGGLTVTVESESTVMGCRACGVVAHGHGRIEVALVDTPAMGRPVTIL